MSIFSKLKFWGKKDSLDFDKDLGLDLGPLPGEKPDQGMPDFSQNLPNPETSQMHEPSLDPMQPSMAQERPLPTFEPVQQESHESTIANKNLEVISYKLDAIQAILNSINQRLNNLENESKEDQLKGRYSY